MRPPVRIGNASGFYGDRSSALREMLTGGPLDVLTGDYLAELTMLILARDRLRDPDLGYAKTFLRQLEESLGLVVERGVRVVVNAGGLNPAGLAARVRELSVRVGLPVAVGHVEGDDDGAPTGAVASSTYLGCWGIVECLRGGADVVVTGRVTDASLVVGPAAWHHGWARDDWDALAGATVAGHVLECGAQATGGNYSYFRELDVRHPGFPLAEVASDGSAVITKHPGTGGAVTVDTVTAQLLYEIGEPRYAGPDVVSRFDTIRLRADGADRVRISGVRGEPPPPTLKVGIIELRGFRNATTFVLTGLDVAAKAALVREQVETALAGARPERLVWTLARTDHPDADTEEAASALLHVVAQDPDAEKVGRAFSRVPIELALASYPGFHVTAPPGDASPYGVFTPAAERPGDGRACRGAARRPAGAGAAAGDDPRPGAGSPGRAAHPGRPRPHPARAARAGRRCPFRRQGRHGQHRRLGPLRRGLPLAGRIPRRGAAAAAPAGDRAVPDGPLAAAGPAGDELRGRRDPRRGCLRGDPVRPAGQGAR